MSARTRRNLSIDEEEQINAHAKIRSAKLAQFCVLVLVNQTVKTLNWLALDFTIQRQKATANPLISADGRG
jgi:hypothetical protein